MFQAVHVIINQKKYADISLGGTLFEIPDRFSIRLGKKRRSWSVIFSLISGLP